MSKHAMRADPDLLAAIKARLAKDGYSGDSVAGPILELVQDRLGGALSHCAGPGPDFADAIGEVFEELSVGGTLDQASVLVAYLELRYRSSALDRQLCRKFRSRFDCWSIGYTYEAYVIAKDDLRRHLERRAGPYPADDFNVRAIVWKFAVTAVRNIRGGVIDYWAEARAKRDHGVQIMFNSEAVSTPRQPADEGWVERVELSFDLAQAAAKQLVAISTWRRDPNRAQLMGWRNTPNALSPADDGNAAKIEAAALEFRNLCLGLTQVPDSVRAVRHHLPQKIGEDELFQWAACILADPAGQYYNPEVPWSDLRPDEQGRYRKKKFALWSSARALLQWSFKVPEEGAG